LHIRIKNIDPSYLGKTLTLAGWVRTLRDQKNFAFIELNDGSTFHGIQIVMDSSISSYEELLKNISTGASIVVKGTLVESPGAKQKWEVKATEIEILGTCLSEDYPLQKSVTPLNS
jgi:asparaginyl-tRNA synthetase